MPRLPFLLELGQPRLLGLGTVGLGMLLGLRLPGHSHLRPPLLLAVVLVAQAMAPLPRALPPSLPCPCWAQSRC